ncbi:hypothetical protein MKW94_023776, partial [Papaver nudicaule]|nr:hypothetical protein [Papaver nudicaule]
MAGPGELVSDDPDIDTIGKKMSLGLQQAVESLHQEMKSLGQQQVESLQEMKSLLKVLVESQVNTQLQLSQIVNNTSITTGINCKNDKENQSASQSPLSSSITNHHQPGLASTSSTLLSTPENDTIITAGATDISAANMERQPTVTDNQEITQVITDDHSDRGEKT